MNAHTTSLVLRIALFTALLFPLALSSQTPAEPGRLNITSTPDGANITINGKSMDHQTDAVYSVAPGQHKVSVAGGAGNLNCPEITVQVSSGRETKVHCSSAGWAR